MKTEHMIKLKVSSTRKGSCIFKKSNNILIIAYLAAFPSTPAQAQTKVSAKFVSKPNLPCVHCTYIVAMKTAFNIVPICLREDQVQGMFTTLSYMTNISYQSIHILHRS